ncbi:MAG: hypothetical protein COB83_04015 [Gammaproteobacteria bacterium]|nr:MAG: hypothetical protein COB83_04015 [Gammaproteobacteria bacterium]
MKKLFQRLKKHVLNNDNSRIPTIKTLLCIDADNVSPKLFLQEGINLEQFSEIELYCNTTTPSRWLNHRYYDRAIYHLAKVEKDAADRKLTSRLIKLLIDHNETIPQYRCIYICTNDLGFTQDINNIAKRLPIAMISKEPLLLGIQTLSQSIKINNSNQSLIKKNHQLIRPKMHLNQVGSILRANGISYLKLTPYLVKNGYEVDTKSSLITRIPTIN